MSTQEPQANACPSPSSVGLHKENWLSLPEYGDAKPLFCGGTSRLQVLRKNKSATRNIQIPMPQSFASPTLTDDPLLELSLSLPKVRGRSRVKASPKAPQVKVSTDPFFGSDFVYSLNVFNSREFLMRKAAVLVLFYCPHDKDITEIRNHYTSSASSTKRENHAYAAVDCTQEPELCTAFGITLTPVVAYYSRGIKIDSGLVESQEFVKDDLRFFMEQAPIYNDPKLKAYGKPKIRKTLRGIKSPGRSPPNTSVWQGRKSPESSRTSHTPTRR
ncbi:hypothetical protein BsWGS_16991 [Bradybaena similaris]